MSNVYYSAGSSIYEIYSKEYSLNDFTHLFTINVIYNFIVIDIYYGVHTPYLRYFCLTGRVLGY